MKLQAVTICINYADYLETAMGNRRHFDRWVVVTVPKDGATVALCQRHGVEVVFSMVLQADGKDFDAAYGKTAVINEGLALLGADGWALILDADVVLPRHLRDRLKALPLEAGCLCGLAGRRVCEDRESLEMLRDLEPWDRLVGRNTQALGYFNLFHLGSTPNRYPESDASKRGEHDDFRFTTSFPPEARRQVPMTVIHAGPTHTNWARRVSRAFAAEAVTGSDFETLLENVAGASEGGTVGIAGYFPGGCWRAVAELFSEALLVDHFAVDAPSGHALTEADREVLRELMEKECAGLPGVKRLGAHSAGTLAKIADGSLEAIYLPGEVAPSWLVEALPRWLEKLKPGGIVFGDLYGLPHWREATFTIALLLGPPDETGGDGSWWKRLSEKPRLRSPLPAAEEDRQAGEQDGVVLVNSGKATVAALLLTAHSGREFWPGPVRIYHWGEEDESLAIACSRLGIALWQVGSEEAAGADELEERMAEVAAIQPYRRAILLRGGMLATQPLELPFLTKMTVAERSEGTLAFPVASPLMVERGHSHPLPVAAARDLTENQEPIVFFTGAPEAWSEAAWETWSWREAGMASEMAAEIRIPTDVTLVSVVTADNVGDFQRNWLPWRFRGEPPVVLLLAGVVAADLWLRCDAACPAVLHDTAAAREEEAITNNRFLPEPFFGMVSRDLLKAIAASRAAKKLCEHPLSLLMRMAMEELGAESSWSDASRTGWKFPPTHHYRRRNFQKPAVESRVITCVACHGKRLRHLAEDVVVISLPERTDRRERIAAMMKREGVAFRFVDGIRVADTDILPEEVAEVGWAGFKTVATWEKYLRGMVGCRRAHLGVLEQAFEAGLRSLLIFEDDMTFEDGWRERLDAALAELPSGWLQLYFSAAEFFASECVSPHLRRLAGAYQTTAILYSEAGIEAGLECLRKSRMEIDCWMGKHLHPYGNSYAVNPRICHQDGRVSDIMGFDRGITH